MRKFVTAAATALTLGVMALASPAMADQYGNQYGDQYGNQGYHDLQPSGEWRGHGDRGGYRNDNRDWNRHDRGFDRWERGWGRDGSGYDRHARSLSYWQIVRSLERQGFYGVRGLRESRWSWGLRAYAYDRRGRPVMLRVNPYNGRVIDLRYV